jgi:hypothetical protein
MYWMQFEMFPPSLAWKLGLYPKTKAHLLEISNISILPKHLPLGHYAIYMFQQKFERFVLGLASKLGLHPVTI